jgi:O-antigen/teichoic acid export membrane protein
MRVLAMPMSLVAASAADVFHARFAHIVNSGEGDPRKFFLKTIMGLFAVGLIPMLAILWRGPAIFGLVLGAGWRESGRYAVYIAPWALAQLAISPVSRVIAVLDGKRLKLLYDAASLVGTILVFWWGHHYSASIYKVLLALSAMNVLTYVILFAILLHAISKHEASALSVGRPVFVGEE